MTPTDASDQRSIHHNQDRDVFQSKLSKKATLPAGFEPTRGDPIGFQVQRLNHSAKAACLASISTII